MNKQYIILLFILVAVIAVGIYFLKPAPPAVEPLQQQNSSDDSLEHFYQTSQQLGNQNSNTDNQDLINKLNDPNTIIK